jgi:RyR domain
MPHPHIPVEPPDPELSPEVLAITEILARHVHDTWVRMRLTQGWRNGPQRDDGKKEHPCLVPYDELPEDEKESDRQTTLATLRGLSALGFEIRKR